MDPGFLEHLRLSPRAIIGPGASEGEIEAAFATFGKIGIGALSIVANPFFNSRRNQLIGLAARAAIPAMHENREATRAGGLMSYGTSVPDVYRQIGIYTARVLKGDKPPDLPILLPTKFEMAINLKTAKTLGLTVPTSLLLRADEVIE